tara:strand:+ start:366 stop:590 length:225 start_codon:yes stop_codon:yes gene_type:complete
MSFGQWIRDQIKLSNINNVAFAIELSVSENTVSSWCNDKTKPRMESFFLACKLFAKLQAVDENTILTEAKLFYA